MTEVYLLSHPSSEYLAETLASDLTDVYVNLHRLNVIRQTFPNGERYYRLDIPTPFALLGKIAIYISAVTNDDELLDLYRIGNTLAQAGLRRRVFVIPFLAYTSMDRAMRRGEVVTAKCNAQMMGSLGAAEDGTLFLFLDLHDPCLLHYFEGPCLRIEFQARDQLVQEIKSQRYDLSQLVIGTTNLRRAAWANLYARDLGVGIAFMREKARGDGIVFQSRPEGVVGDVKGKHVLIYDDIIRSGRTIIAAAEMYLDSGATGVDVVTCHLACFEEAQIQAIVESRIGVVIATNSHPVTQRESVRNHPKFRIVNIVGVFSKRLETSLPSTEAALPYGSSYY
jgi:ribose-phosphate pyrophosphokinase